MKVELPVWEGCTGSRGGGVGELFQGGGAGGGGGGGGGGWVRGGFDGGPVDEVVQ